MYFAGVGMVSTGLGHSSKMFAVFYGKLLRAAEQVFGLCDVGAPSE